MIEKILITGASGFVGYHLTRAAKEAGLEVHAAVRKSSDVSEISSVVDKFVYPDFTDVDAIRALLESEHYTYVVHAAAMTRAKREEDLERVNVNYTRNLAAACFSLQNPIRRFVFVSSLAAIGPVSYASGLINEHNPYAPVTAYGRSKRKAELALNDFDQQPLTILRPTAVYGPREKDIFILFKTMNGGLDAYVGRSPQKLSFIYVADLVQAILNACRFDQGGKHVYNLSDGQVYDRYEMAKIFREFGQKRMLRMHIPLGIVKAVAVMFERLYKNSKAIPVLYPERLNELTAENWGCDIASAQRQIHYRPNYDLRAGLMETLVWYKQNKWL
ncbi:NAD-dependent epimerase/dehydratase family protein [Sphingobacterium sp. InxBP1]|uniref:NAD-dependent epimerase/dehydratase family protein n=1 Tax=Sphingobacterium sp. InxBP1 TaxID=2870328 RepID=UPI002244073C|nr:NAD-dependent epimerase/dehydratase family protein [Sphingobacterium sp. InxBP1]MCW8312067.1 NAD-dependent epimerase/dehydratase family protein [Sphingobacterium sp. InxBP1]